MRRFLAACALLSALPFPLRASVPVFISEAAWAGSPLSLADEWIELCGPPGTDLSGWKVSGAAGSDITLPSGAAIGASGAYLISNYGAEDAKSALAAVPDLVTTAISLSNSSLAVTLQDAEGAAVDAAGAAGSAPPAGSSGETKATMERLDAALDGTVSDAWVTASVSSGFDAGVAALGSPGSCDWQGDEAPSGPAPAPEDPEENEDEPQPAPTDGSATSSPEMPDEEDEAPPVPPAPAAPQTPAAEAAPVREEPLAAVRVSEIYPSPLTGEREWLELVNRSGIGEFLDGWTLEDDRGTKTHLAGLIPAWGYAVIEAPKGSLNNDGDLALLRDRFGREIDRIAYPKVTKGEAYMREELQDTFVMTLTATRGAANLLASKETEPEEPKEEEETVPAAKPEAAAAKPVVEKKSEGLAAAETRQVESFTATSEPKAAPKPATNIAGAKKEAGTTKKAAAKPKAKAKAPAPKYKGDAHEATVVVPTGTYSKTRAYILRDGAIEELRVTKAPAAPWNVGDRISFIAQMKSEGSVSYLQANPNSVMTTGSASATFASAESWPTEAGAYRLVAEVSGTGKDTLSVRLGGTEGDVLVPSGMAATLKPGDRVRIEGFVSPGARPRVVLATARGVTLEQARAEEEDGAGGPLPSKLPVPLTAGLTVAAAGVGLAAYLRTQRLKRLELSQAASDGAWE